VFDAEFKGEFDSVITLTEVLMAAVDEDLQRRNG
jgi:hypothetical protein